MLSRYLFLIGAFLLLTRLTTAQPAPVAATSSDPLETFRRNCLQAMTRLNHVQMAWEDLRTNSATGSAKTLQYTEEIQYPYFRGTAPGYDPTGLLPVLRTYSFDGSRYYHMEGKLLTLMKTYGDLSPAWNSNPLSIPWDPIVDGATYLPLVSGELSILPIPPFSSLQLSPDGKGVELRYADTVVTFQGGFTGYPTWSRTGNYATSKLDILAWTTSPDGTTIPKVIQTVETTKDGIVIKDVITLESLTTLPESPASHFAISFDAASVVYDEDTRTTLKSSKRHH